MAAIQAIIDEERAKHAASKHAHACEYARDAVAKFLDMVCVVLKVREDNGRKPMPYPDYRTLKEVYVSAEPYFVDDDPGPPPPGDASASARGRPLLKDWPSRLVKVIGAGASATRSASVGIRATP